MKGDDVRKSADPYLRARAEKKAIEREVPKNLEDMSAGEIKHLLHELNVHQIELEMQNEELRRAQADLESSRARYFDLYDLAPVGYVAISEDGFVLEANLTAAGLLGVDRSALAGHPFTGFVYKEDQDIYYLRSKKLFETGEPQKYEMRMIRGGEFHFWTHVETTAGRESDGSKLCRAVLSDISGRKHMEDEIKRHQNHLQELVAERTEELTLAYAELKKKRDSLAEAQRIGRMGNWEWNIATNDMMWSEEIYHIFGLKPREFNATYESLLMCVYPDDREHVKVSINEALEKGIPYSFDHRILLPDGTRRIIHERVAVFRDGDGKTIRMAGTIQDITRRKQVEEELKARARQLRLLSRKVITSQEEERVKISRDLHDTLGQRLVAMSSTIRWLEKQNSPGLEELVKLKEMVAETNVALQRIYKGLRPMVLDKLGLEAAIESLIWDYRDQSELNIKVSIKPIECKIDYIKEISLYRILQEALTNIVRHSGAGQVKVSLKCEAAEIVLDVVDDGHGFERNREPEMNGFGIAGMQERVALCGGTLDLKSEPGQGTRVRVRIPIDGIQKELEL